MSCCPACTTSGRQANKPPEPGRRPPRRPKLRPPMSARPRRGRRSRPSNRTPRKSDRSTWSARRSTLRRPARRAGSDGADFAHEPRGASRDEEHGDAGLQRVEVEEIAEEAAAALEGDEEPEEHLTAPLLDPADTKALAAELQTMSRAADPDKG